MNHILIAKPPVAAASLSGSFHAVQKYSGGTGHCQGNPSLIGSTVSDYLNEAAKRLRQQGNERLATSVEHWLSLLRMFRAFGVEDGHLEIAIDQLARAKSPEDHRQVLSEYPELKSDAADEYLKRRIKESNCVNDIPAQGKYRMASHLVHATYTDELDGLGAGERADTTEAVNTFRNEFVLKPDVMAGRRLLEVRPDLLHYPLSFVVGSMFQPSIDRARSMNDLLTLRGLLLPQAIFHRCQTVGVGQAYDELARGVKWSELGQSR